MMNHTCPSPQIAFRVLASIAILFGLATIKSGGDVLFWSPQAKAAAGAYVPFVLWFNFLTGPLYVAAGILILRKNIYAIKIAKLLSAGILVVGIALLVHIASGGDYEIRTLVAMAIRFGLWTFISLVLTRHRAFLK